MHKAAPLMRRGLSIAASIVGLAFAGFCLVPIGGFIQESWSLARMDQTATATIDTVNLVIFERSSSRRQLLQDSHWRITYHFQVGAMTMKSDRTTCSYIAGPDLRTARDRGVKPSLKPGDTHIVHFRTSDPSACCLEFGWSSFTAQLVLLLGLPMVCAFIGESLGSVRSKRWGWSLCSGFMATGALMGLFLDPFTIEIARIWHWLGMLLVIVAPITLVAWSILRIKSGPESPNKPVKSDV